MCSLTEENSIYLVSIHRRNDGLMTIFAHTLLCFPFNAKHAFVCFFHYAERELYYRLVDRRPPPQLQQACTLMSK